MNLKKMNLVELNAQEVNTIDGGSWLGDAIRIMKKVIDLVQNPGRPIL
jgi:hypothetical protein